MNKHRGLKTIFNNITLLVIACILSTGFTYRASISTGTNAGAIQTSTLNQLVYFPVSFGTEGLFQHSFGGETYLLSNDTILDKAQDVNMHWIRYGAFYWNQIEPTRMEPPEYNWGVVDDDALQNAAEHNLDVIAVIRFAPTWAQKIPGVGCGPIAENALDAFAQFVGEAVSRYSGPPFYIKYWELGNEPDINPSLVPPYNVYGCWGDVNDDYFGGGYYAQMLERVYPAVKAADPEAKVLNGGFVFDCDPTNPPPGKDCRSSMFLEGMLRYNNNQGGNYFDMLSFHGYAFYYRPNEWAHGLILDDIYPSWEDRGGQVLGKVDYIRELMSAYNVDKPIIHTEGALLCPSSWPGNIGCNPPEPEFFEAQAEYVVWMFVRNISIDLFGGIWYAIEDVSYRYSSLLNRDLSQKPAYNAYQFMSLELEGARYLGPVNDYQQFPDIRAFAFWKPGANIWVMWATNRQDHLITLPSGVLKAYDKYGNEKTPSGGQITVNSPVYVELAP